MKNKEIQVQTPLGLATVVIDGEDSFTATVEVFRQTKKGNVPYLLRFRMEKVKDQYKRAGFYHGLQFHKVGGAPGWSHLTEGFQHIQTAEYVHALSDWALANPDEFQKVTVRRIMKARDDARESAAIFRRQAAQRDEWAEDYQARLEVHPFYKAVLAEIEAEVKHAEA